MRTRATCATLAVLAVLVSGCGSSSQSGGSSESSSSSSSQQAGGDPSTADMNMNMDMGSTGKPSEPAAMICEAEIQDAVKRTFAMSSKPSAANHWMMSTRVFTCRWSVPQGTLLMSVQDALKKKTGRAYFDRLKTRLHGTKITGMESFGFPAFRTAGGDVAFLKDGKTLQVDATRLPAASLPKGFSRGEAAFSVASAVIACWTE